jgi:hypothetical protein
MTIFGISSMSGYIHWYSIGIFIWSNVGIFINSISNIRVFTLVAVAWK